MDLASWWDQTISGLRGSVRRRLAGGALVVAGALITIGITVAGSLYPGYSIHAQTISELGATDASGQLVQPAATVFTLSMGSGGSLVILAGLAARSALGLHEIKEKAHDFSRGMNPTTRDTNYPR